MSSVTPRGLKRHPAPLEPASCAMFAKSDVTSVPPSLSAPTASEMVKHANNVHDSEGRIFTSHSQPQPRGKPLHKAPSHRMLRYRGQERLTSRYTRHLRQTSRQNRSCVYQDHLLKRSGNQCRPLPSLKTMTNSSVLLRLLCLSPVFQAATLMVTWSGRCILHPTSFAGKTVQISIIRLQSPPTPVNSSPNYRRRLTCHLAQSENPCLKTFGHIVIPGIPSSIGLRLWAQHQKRCVLFCFSPFFWQGAGCCRPHRPTPMPHHKTTTPGPRRSSGSIVRKTLSIF